MRCGRRSNCVQEMQEQVAQTEYMGKLDAKAPVWRDIWKVVCELEAQQEPVLQLEPEELQAQLAVLVVLATVLRC